MRVLFFGNHTVGVAALKVLLKLTNVLGVVAHPPDPEDGVRYESVFEYASNKGVLAIRGKASDTNVATLMAETRPDLIWITDYRYLLPASIIQAAPSGAINLHPSLLPQYRGRAPINWAILNGETRLGLTAHFVDEGTDSGDIIEQVAFDLREHEDVGDALKKLMPLYEEVTHRVVTALKDGQVARRTQYEAKATIYPARKPEDGLIDWKHPATVLRNLIRAVAAPYPGAFSFFGGRRLTIWKAGLVGDERERPAEPGQVIALDRGLPVIACGKGALILSSYQAEDESQPPLVVGEKFTKG